MRLVRVLLIVLVVVIAVVAVAGGSVWWYLARVFEEPPVPIVAAETRRTVGGGDVVGFVDRPDTYAWLGIPYAASPIGPLRWRAPQPLPPWSGVRESLVRGAQCPQGEIGGGGAFAGDEDCLYLNVWSPVGRADSGRPVPVMFWIHGGGNHIGEGGTPLYNGARLAGTHDVVVVSINYRLGPLGWFRHPALATGDPLDDSGNYGVLDIIHALRWVRDNVAAFGGDPANVTIFGESAGGWNVQALMVSPLAAGLYHKAIAQSGGLRIVPVAETLEYGIAQRTGFRELVDNLLMADDAGLDQSGAQARQESMAEDELAGYLRSKGALEILAAQGGAGFGGTATLLGDGHVLPDDLQAAELFAAGRYNVTPAIFGTNRDEVKLFAAFSPEATDRLFGILPYRVRDPERYDRDTGYSSDAWKVGAVDRLAIPLRAAQGPTVFAYRFDWDAMRSVGTLDLARLFGAAHALEIPFVFGTLDFLDRLGIVADYDVPERDALSQTMMSYWAEFAWTGDPGRGRNGEQVEWSAWENGAGARRLLLLDASSDGGVRMSSSGSPWTTCGHGCSRTRASQASRNTAGCTGRPSGSRTSYRRSTTLWVVEAARRSDHRERGPARPRPLPSRLEGVRRRRGQEVDMLTAQENARLTQTGPGTPMGDVFRSYWMPALLSRELPEPDCPPLRVKLLGEDLVAFRDTRGRVGIVEPACTHRGANLFFGRVEECGIRCAYHGWKFDVEGRCLEIPTLDLDTAERVKPKAALRALEVREFGDVVWAWMGEGDAPELPQFEFATLPPEHRHVSKKFQQCNWAQACEGGLDTAHFSYLHAGMRGGEKVGLHEVMGMRRIDGDNEPPSLARYRWMIEDGRPEFTVLEHPAGLLLCAARQADDGARYWRMTQFLMPNHSLAPGNFPEDNNLGNTWVPVDDESCWIFCYCWNPDRPLTDKEVERMEQGSGIFAEVDEHYMPVRRRENDYLIDRTLQREQSFTGIVGISEQDQAIADSQGLIADRTRELLGQTDLGVVRFRQLALQAAKDRSEGRTPKGVDAPGGYHVRSGDAMGGPADALRDVIDGRFGVMSGLAAG